LIIVRRNLWVVLILLVASLFAAAIWGSPIYYRLIYLWILLISTSYVWTLLSLRGVGVTRQARTFRQQVGQIFEERFEVTNNNRFPRLWVVVRDESSLPGTAGSRVLTWIGGHQERTYLSYTWLTRRGLFNLGPTVLESGDLFGLFSTRVAVQTQASLLVTPFLVELQRFTSPPGYLPGGRALHRRTLEVTPYAAGVREYTPGDSLNRIHWPTTARRDRLMVKDFEQDPQADVWIFIDAQKAVQAALPEEQKEFKGDRLWLWRHRPDEVTLPPTTFDYAVSIAASIGLYFIQLGRAVGMASAGQVYTVLPAERGERQLSKMFDTLAFLQGQGDLPLFGLTSSQVNHLPRGSTVILITPSSHPGVLLAADDLSQRNMHPIVILINAETFGGVDGASDTALSLAERGIPVIRVSNGADLKAALESSTGSPNITPEWRTQNEGKP